MSAFTTCLIHNNEDVEWEVEYVYRKGMKSPRDEYGLPESPDDEPEIEILSVTDKAGNEVEPTKEQSKLIEERAWEALEKEITEHE